MSQFNVLSVGDWLRGNNVPFSGNVTSTRAELQATETALLERFPEFPFALDRPPYKRYGYIMNDLVATRYAASMQALDLGFRARLTNSGMAAIDTAVRVAVGRIAKKTPDGARIVHASELYPETPKLLEEYATMTNGACLKFSGGELWADEPRSDGDLFFMETVGNHPRMPVQNLEQMLRRFWNYNGTVILDNTIPSYLRLNPFTIYGQLRETLGDPKMSMVVIESLTKYYRPRPESQITAGIIVAPESFIDECDAVIARTGAYLPFGCLEKLPWGAAEALKMTVAPSSLAASKVAGWLEQAIDIEWVSYPRQHDFPAGAGSMLYFVPKESITAGMVKSFGACMGSFGHAKTTWMPWGQLVPGDYPESTIRLSCGWGDSSTSIIQGVADALNTVPVS